MTMTTKNPSQGELFESPFSDTGLSSLLSESYQKQSQKIEKPIDFVSRKAIELYPFDFLQFFSEFENLSAEEREKIKILDANRTLELYLKREADSLSLIIETNLSRLKDTAFHIEIQTAYDETMDERILDYNFIIKRKTKKQRVKTLLINLDPDSKCQQLGHQDFGSIKLTYNVINLWEQDYQEIKQKGRLGLLPLTPYLKGSGRDEIAEASEILTEEISDPLERAEMIFLLAVLAGRRYKTAGFKLLSRLATMNLETFRDDPTAKELIHLLYPNELFQAETKGIEKGRFEATELFRRRAEGVLSEKQMKQLFGE